MSICSFGDPLAERIVPIQDDRSSGGNCFGQCAFFFRNRLARSHEFHMSNADVGDNGGVGRGNFRQWGDFAGVIHSNFPDRDFIVRSRLQNGARQPDMVIEVALRFGDAEFSAEN